MELCQPNTIDHSIDGTTSGNSSTGIKPKLVYVLTTSCIDRYADMALVSMLSVALTNPEITTVLLVDTISLKALKASHHRLLEISDSVVAVNTPPGSGEFRSRWIKTQVGLFIQGAVIYLDIDTIIRGSIDWPSNFHGEFGAVPDSPGKATWENPRRLEVSKKLGWNPATTYYNGGFFYYVTSPATNRFFETWHSLWQETHEIVNNKDQPSFNAAITIADFKEKELPESFNHQILLSWKNCHQSKVWHFQHSSRMNGDILDELTRESSNLSIDELRARVSQAMKKNTPAAYSNHFARAMDLLLIDPEVQRKLLLQKSRLSTAEFLEWSLRKLVGR